MFRERTSDLVRRGEPYEFEGAEYFPAEDVDIRSSELDGVAVLELTMVLDGKGLSAPMSANDARDFAAALMEVADLIDPGFQRN